jgi:hypothetical protein
MQWINHNTPLCFCAYVNSVCEICRISIVVSATDHFLHIRPEYYGLCKVNTCSGKTETIFRYNLHARIAQCMNPSCQPKEDMLPQYRARLSYSTRIY